MTDKAIILDTPHGITYFQLAAMKGAVKLEALGMKHSSGRSVRKHACQILGLKPSTKAAEVVKALEAKLAEMLAEKQSGAVK
jgi:hypothetical protein